MSNKLYNQLKFVAQILLPAVGALYFGLAGIWDLPASEEVVGTITVIDAFLGTILGFSTKAYKDNRVAGDIVVGEHLSGMPKLHLELDKPNIEQLVKQDELVFRVKEAPRE